MVIQPQQTHPDRPPQPRPARRLARVLAVTAAATTALAITAAGGAHAVPTPDKQAVKAQVDQLFAEAEQASEKSNAAEADQARLQGEASILQQQVAEGQEALNRMQGQLASLAAAEYRSGGMDASVQLMLSSDPAHYLTRARTLGQAAEQRTASLHEVVEQQRRLDQRRAEATGKLTELDSVRQALAQHKQEVQERLKRAQALLNTLGARERDQLAAQDAQEAHERAAQAAQAGEKIDLGHQPPSSERAAVALAAAIGKLGSPYVYGSTGPSTFDCSGLMYWAWRQAGVTLPRTSQQQAFGGQRVSLAEARPGDLVIFFKDMHHVGMYAGGGVVVHAPYPGTRVRYESVSAMPVAAVVRV